MLNLETLLILKNTPLVDKLKKEFETNVSDLQKLDEDTLLSAGFRYWDEGLMLIPDWFFPYLKRGEPLTDINGKNVFVSPHLDRDTRGGMLAYGFKYQGRKHGTN